MDTLVEQTQVWRQAISDHYPRVRAWFARVLIDQGAVDDLAQEVFVRLCSQFNDGQVVMNPWNFIKVVAKNVFMEHLRAQKKRKGLLPLDSQTPSDRFAQPAEICAQQEVSKVIPRLLVHLAESDRYIMVGKYSLGMTVRELADAMGTAPSTIMERHNRALCQLRKLAVSQGIGL